MRMFRAICWLFLGFAFFSLAGWRCQAQAALLMENADGISRVFDVTGHEAVYFARICAATPTRLRRCGPDESGSVIARYKGIAGYDWLAVPLLPYLYSVENASAVPSRVNHETVHILRRKYHETHLMSLGEDVPEGGRVQRGWNQLVGAAYERRIYAFRFATTEEQDDAFIAWMNGRANRSHFNIVFRNCANFAGGILNFYFPHTVKRHVVPDWGIVTPRQVAYELARYGRRRPEIELTVLEIPLVPGYRRPGRTGRSVSQSLIVTGEVVPLAVLNPFVGGTIAADGLLWGRYPLPLRQARVLAPEKMTLPAARDESEWAEENAPLRLTSR